MIKLQKRYRFNFMEKIDSFIDKIYKDINNYLKSNNLSIKYIAPIYCVEVEFQQ